MEVIGLPTPHGHVIFCEDVRHEVGGKITFNGVYLTEMNVGSGFPVILPKFCLAIHYYASVDDCDEPVQVKVMLPGATIEAPSMAFEVPVGEFKNVPYPPDLDPTDDFYVGGMFVAQFSPLKIDKPGKMYVRVIRGDKTFKWGALRVSQPISPAADAKPKVRTRTRRKPA
jgi:hypothetical protein